MLYVIYILKILLLSSIPIAIGIYLTRKFDLEGKLWWISVIVYGVSQIILLPLENYFLVPYLYSLNGSVLIPSIALLLIGGLILGLSVGVCEEVLRYAMYRWLTKGARSFEGGLLLGAGYGGAAALFLAFQVLAYWTDTEYYTSPVVISQILMIVIQICLSVMVLQAFSRRQWYWVLLAIGYHTLVETVRIITLNVTNEIVMTAVLGLFAGLSCVIIVSLNRSKVSANPSSGDLDKNILPDNPG
jgi:uncharacterized membrane protein YhfC